MSNYCLCAKCTKDKYLKKYIEKNSQEINICCICNEKQLVIHIDKDEKIKDFCRFLIRYHIFEFEYNTHMGGNGVQNIFYNKNPILSHTFFDDKTDSNREIEIEEFILELFDGPESSSKIKLYKSNISWFEDYFVDIIKDEKSPYWKQIKNDLQENNYYLLENNAKIEFKNYINDICITIKKETRYFRGRNWSIELEEENFYWIKSKIKNPYSWKELWKTPTKKAKAWRMNRSWISYLYLGSSVDTCISEIKTYPWRIVSVWEFIVQKDINLIDFRVIPLENYFEDKNKLEVFKFLRDISDELSKPIWSDEESDYLVTQFISDIIRMLWYDGILYNSSVSNDGYNIAIFNDNNIIYKDNSSILYNINSMEFSYSEITKGYHPVTEEIINIIE